MKITLLPNRVRSGIGPSVLLLLVAACGSGAPTTTTGTDAGTDSATSNTDAAQTATDARDSAISPADVSASSDTAVARDGSTDASSPSSDAPTATDAARDASSASTDAAPDTSAPNPCGLNPCMNGGTCSGTTGVPVCTCAAGYSGPVCATNIDECAGAPCQNGGTCADGVNTFTCTCAAGFTGMTCGTNVDDCAPNPCANGGTCADGVNGFTCTCAAGFSGTRCDGNIDDCSPNPCQNSGTCADGTNGFTCTCAAGFSGATCATNVDDCAPNPCMNGGTCADGVNTFTCTCAPGYSGTNCATNIDECAGAPCQNGGTCADGVNSFTCTCAPGFSGDTCQIDIDECASSPGNPCQNGGTCVDGANMFTCTCAPGYSGPTCATNIDECSPNPCANGGVCSDRINAYRCDCPAGFGGTECANVVAVQRSCLEILDAALDSGSGLYYIDTDGLAGPRVPLQVYCDMQTDGGGYTFYRVTGGLSTLSRNDANSCQALGLQMVIPRTSAHYSAMIARFNDPANFRVVPGIYGTRVGNYTGCPMNSTPGNNCSRDWRAIDGGSWWLRDAAYSEPNGDYTANLWLGTDNQFPHQRFNDLTTGYASTGTYICSTNDKDALPITNGLAAHYSTRNPYWMTLGSANTVLQWKDISGNARHLTPNVLGPTYAENLINGRPAMEFEGTSRRMTTEAFPLTTDVTVFAVVQWRTPEGWGNIAHHGNRDGDWSLENNSFTGPTSVHWQSVNDNAGLELTVPATTNAIFAGRIDGTARSFSMTTPAGTMTATGTGNSISAGDKVLYVGSSDIFEDSNAYIGEIVYFSRALSDAERTSIIQYLQSAWGLQP